MANSTKRAILALIAAIVIAVLTAPGCSIIQSQSSTASPPLSPSSPASASLPFPSGTTYTPSAAPFTPGGTQAELFQYALDLVNQDRQAAGLAPVTLGSNGAAQKHAQDMFDNYFLSHWGTDGLKPYMRYTQEGGLNYEAENSAYSGPLQKLANPGTTYAKLDPRTEIKSLEFAMMNDDAASNWGHRDNILNPLHQKVNLGLAYDLYHLAFVQEFEGDYLRWTQPPTLAGSQLSAALTIALNGIEINNVSITYDPLPQPQTASQLNSGPHNYSLGQSLNFLISPPPPGMFYSNVNPLAIQAAVWQIDKTSGRFSFQADISHSLSAGSGVYTIVLVANLNGTPKGMSNYSLFVK
jgi:uncharacterized protein YkwD